MRCLKVMRYLWNGQTMTAQETPKQYISQRRISSVMEHIVPNRMAEDGRSGDRMERERRGVL